MFTRISTLMKNELKKIGQKVLVEAVLHTPQSVSDFGRMASEFQSAVLKFRQAGVDHVLFDEYAGEMPFFGLTVAENQRYRPRWAFNSTNLTNTIQAQHDDRQLTGAVSVTWLPGQDIADIHDPRMNKGVLAKCFDIIKKGGMVPSRLYTGIFCDSFLFLQKILSTTNNVTPEGMGEAAAKVGTTLRVAVHVDDEVRRRTDGRRELRPDREVHAELRHEPRERREARLLQALGRRSSGRLTITPGAGPGSRRVRRTATSSRSSLPGSAGAAGSRPRSPC